MNTAIIPVVERRIGEELIQTVDARELHAFLEVRSEFRNWIKNRIDDFGFVDNRDFKTLVENYRGGERKDYYLALDMAKEISMVERNEQGKRARLYFIDCERRAKQLAVQLPDFCNPVIAARAWAEQYEQRLQSEIARKQLAAVNAELAPKAEFHDVVTQATNCQTIEAAAKVLGWGRNRLFDFLRKEHILIARSTLPYQRFIDSGHFRVIEVAFTKHNGESGTSTKTLVTGKGLVLIQKRISPQVMLQAMAPAGRDLVN